MFRLSKTRDKNRKSLMVPRLRKTFERKPVVEILETRIAPAGPPKIDIWKGGGRKQRMVCPGKLVW